MGRVVVGHAAEVAAAWQGESPAMEPPTAAAHASSWSGSSSHRLGMESRVWGLEILGRFGGAWVDFG